MSHPRMVQITGIAFLGLCLGELAFIIYWMVYEPRPEYARAHIISLCVNVALFLGFLKFMKFMERP